MDPIRLILVMAFDRSDEGEHVAAFEAMQFDVEERAVRASRDLAPKHAGVIAWVREAEPDAGEHPPTILLQSGEVPEME